MSAPSSKGSSGRGQGAAIIGPSINIKGDVSGDEDLLIQGRIDGTVNLKKHNVTVGSDGRVKADIFGRSVTVEGEVEGDLHGDEQIVLRQSARVQGNISAPRVSLEDGASFRGSIDMHVSGGKAGPPPSPASTSRSLSGKSPSELPGKEAPKEDKPKD